jgi:cell division protein FtsB
MQVGTIAQYWQKVLPEVVTDKNDELSMQYGVAALVAAITTARKVVDHEREIAQLKNRVKALEDENKMLKTKLIA